ncbi:MAG: fibrobacter succinogenes major paralogous domain-containing protein, partial [Prolixibacteraceae bacterium]|nr:fibrobacter succinogenes major paralogous domain-containing protein [Prolixibacteraceae bacterium]
IWIYDYSGTGSYGQNFHLYGCLYDWETACEVCPEGWHLPDDDEWKIMETFLGMPDYLLDIFGTRGGEQNIGGKLAISNTDYWEDDFIKTNETGFSALPGGRRDITYTLGKFYFRRLGKSAFFWTSSDENETYAINRIIIYGQLDRELGLKSAGYSIRCIKN